MECRLKEFSELSNNELYNILRLRNDIFIVEQKCPYDDIDGKDIKCQHLFLEDTNEIAGYLRIIPKGISFPQPSIGRVLVKKKYRGKGIAREMVIKAIQFIEKSWNEKEIKISAQVYLKEFYKSLGFKDVSDIYLEDDIPHVDMLYNAAIY